MLIMAYLNINKATRTMWMRAAMAYETFRCLVLILSVDYLAVLVLVRCKVLCILVHGPQAHAH